MRKGRTRLDAGCAHVQVLSAASAKQHNNTQLKVFVSLSHRQLAADAGRKAAGAPEGVPLEHGGAQRTQQRDAHRSAQRHGSAGMLHKTHLAERIYRRSLPQCCNS